MVENEVYSLCYASLFNTQHGRLIHYLRNSAKYVNGTVLRQGDLFSNEADIHNGSVFKNYNGDLKDKIVYNTKVTKES